MKLKPQSQAVLDLLRERPEGITPLQALSEVGTYRLAARVWELRAAGYNVETERFETHRGSVVARYRLVEAA